MFITAFGIKCGFPGVHERSKPPFYSFMNSPHNRTESRKKNSEGPEKASHASIRAVCVNRTWRRRQTLPSLKKLKNATAVPAHLQRAQQPRPRSQKPPIPAASTFQKNTQRLQASLSRVRVAGARPPRACFSSETVVGGPYTPPWRYGSGCCGGSSGGVVIILTAICVCRAVATGSSFVERAVQSVTGRTFRLGRTFRTRRPFHVGRRVHKAGMIHAGSFRGMFLVMVPVPVFLEHREAFVEGGARLAVRPLDEKSSWFESTEGKRIEVTHLQYS